ncbi:MAG: LysM peptidoglycan-binding domain-containing protein [Lachnospiraceae bacterium]|nr:LysM peptidoglycan-binding domain-containing protein [Lachnospiraceae bacterium]
MRTEQKSIRRMNNGELRFYRCMLRLRRERRRRLLISMFTMLAVACVIIVGSVFYSSIRTQAGNGFKYYTTVTVESGETLWSLADEYVDYNYYRDKNKYISEVKSINHLDEDCTITAGQSLIVPYYSNEYVE